MTRRAALAGCVVVLAALPALPALSATVRAPDAARGERLYVRCAACHALAADRVGPRHCGLYGRRAGSVPGYDYSPAMAASGIRWDAASLDRFLAAPTRVVPGTTMTYDGVRDARDRGDLVAYLARASRAAACAAAG